MTIINVQSKITEGLNEQQKRATLNPIDICTKIVAGAGTGKTKIISKRFVKLVQDLIADNVENPVEKLLVITFTDKAAAEMKGRILSELNLNGIDHIGQDFWVSTIHSFCSRILRKHSIEVGLSPAFKMGDETQLKEIFDNILKRIKYDEASTIADLDEIAADLGLNPLILNIASLNKLRMINALDAVLDDIYPLIKKIKSLGITPQEFLNRTVVATENFAGVVQNIPFSGETKDEYALIWNDYLKKYIADDTILDNDIFDNIAGKKVILDKNNARGKNACLQWGYASGFPEKISETLDLELHLTKIVALIYAIYQKELEKLDLVDFDDLINKTIQILKQNDVIRAYYQKHFKHIIIDEFQDTNGAQLELVELLLSPDVPNLTFVGDRKQSIYGFRFAQMENLEVLGKYVIKNYGKDKLDEITLITNYRSTGSVLDAVNFVTKNELNLDEKLSAGNKSLSEKDKPIKVATLQGFNDSFTHKNEEAKYIADEIIKLKNSDGAQYKDFAILVKSHAQAELISKQLSKFGIPSIKKVNTGFFINPVIKNVIAMFRLSSNFRDEIALVRVLKIILSDSALYKLKLAIDDEVKNGLGDFALKKMNLSDKFLYIQEKSLWDNLYAVSDAKNYSKLILDTFLTISKGKTELSLLQIYYKLINTIKPYANLSGIEQYNTELDLRVFEKIIVDYMQSQNYVSEKTFLEYLDKAKDDKNFELPNLSVKDVDAVQLYTIYASKGLEFPYTFVANIKNKQGNNQDKTNISFDLQYGDKPGFGLIVNKYNGKETAKAVLYNAIWKKPRQKSEELRLFYVAISRAVHYLNVLSFTPYAGTKPVDYVMALSEAYTSEAINTTEIMPVKQEYKPQIALLPQQIFESVGETIPQQTEYNISFSKINTFNQCKSKYLYKYKFSYPEIGTSSEGSMVGSLLHNLIYTGFINNKEFDKASVNKFLENSNLSPNELTRIQKLYESFLKTDYTTKKISGGEFYAERNFNFSILFESNIIRFTGDIDLLLKNPEGKCEIVDFKTNKEIEKSLKNYYMQLSLYKTALESEGLQVANLKIINLTEDEPKILEMSEADIKTSKSGLESDLANLISFDKANVVPECAPNSKCKNCGYRYLC